MQSSTIFSEGTCLHLTSIDNRYATGLAEEMLEALIFISITIFEVLPSSFYFSVTPGVAIFIFTRGFLTFFSIYTSTSFSITYFPAPSQCLYFFLLVLTQYEYQ